MCAPARVHTYSCVARRTCNYIVHSLLLPYIVLLESICRIATSFSCTSQNRTESVQAFSVTLHSALTCPAVHYTREHLTTCSRATALLFLSGDFFQVASGDDAEGSPVRMQQVIHTDDEWYQQLRSLAHATYTYTN
jgi:hypothetical protein